MKTATQTAANIRKGLKKLGYGTSAVSVRKRSASSVTVDVKRADVPFNVIDGIANPEAVPATRCEHNRHDSVLLYEGIDVSVQYTHQVKKAIKEQFELENAEAIAELNANNSARFESLSAWVRNTGYATYEINFDSGLDVTCSDNVWKLSLAFHNAQ